MYTHAHTLLYKTQCQSVKELSQLAVFTWSSFTFSWTWSFGPHPATETTLFRSSVTSSEHLCHTWWGIRPSFWRVLGPHHLGASGLLSLWLGVLHLLLDPPLLALCILESRGLTPLTSSPFALFSVVSLSHGFNNQEQWWWLPDLCLQVRPVFWSLDSLSSSLLSRGGLSNLTCPKSNSWSLHALKAVAAILFPFSVNDNSAFFLEPRKISHFAQPGF